MDRTNKVIALIGLANIIMVCVASGYIPSTGGTVPQDMDLATFQKQQQQIVYASLPFKLTMSGIGGGLLSMFCLVVRAWFINKREERIYRIAVNVKPALKVRRTAVLPEPLVTRGVNVEEIPVPQVVIPVAQVREAVQPPPSVSPPAQLVPEGFEIMELKEIDHTPQKKIQYPGELRRTFKYPPPYDVLNK